jgi:hypothetical protein
MFDAMVSNDQLQAWRITSSWPVALELFFKDVTAIAGLRAVHEMARANKNLWFMVAIV